MKSPLLLETILVRQGKAPFLQLHEDRVFCTARDYGLPVLIAEKIVAIFDEVIQDYLESDISHEDYKCRVLYELVEDEKVPIIIHEVTMTPYTIREINSLQIMDGHHLDYHHKFADRTAINRLVDNRKPDCDDILIVQDGLVTDTSYCNIVFQKDDVLYTPKKPLLAGVRREHLLLSHQVIVKDIYVDQINQYDQVHLINAMIDLGESTVDVASIQ
ncbi:MAG TPA: aminotransferase class IV [Bacteroidaceae bacterium]|mgnify:CR=1 FL=1|nr:aminotransferase class IV [Bacteroidaceae bacterium]